MPAVVYAGAAAGRRAACWHSPPFDADLVDIALQVTAALLAVRIGVHLLAMAMGPRSWVARKELRYTALLWLLLVFALLGWFDVIESRLDTMDLLPATRSSPSGRC